MRPIDRFAGALHREQADELVLETGRPVYVRVSGEERVILGQEVRTDQIENLIREVVPPDCRRIFEDIGEVSFPYSAPTGAVMVALLRRERGLHVSLKPYTGTKRVPIPTHAGRPLQESPRAPLARVALREEVRRPRELTAPIVQAAPSPPPPTRRTPPRSELDAYVERVEAAPLELRLESFAPPALPPEAMEAQAIIDARAQAKSPPPPAPPRPNTYRDVMPAPRRDVMPALPQIPAAPTVVTPQRVEMVPKVEIVAPRVNGQDASIDPMLAVLVSTGGSDLHLTAQLKPHLRKDGEIQGVPGYAEILGSDTIERWLLEIAPVLAIEKWKATNDADFAYELPGLARFRVNIFKDRRGTGGVIRVIPNQILSADQLNLPPAVRNLCNLDKGLVVVTGPTGSGKSTTLAAMIDLINRSRSDHVITIEDPVEFVHEPQRCLVNQREVHTHTESFSTALRAALREDPDIVLVGEMRDLETVKIAIETAETGHLVFGTLHTNTAVSTVDRIIDQFPADRQAQVRVMLSESLKGVIAQTLLKRVGGGRVAALEILIGVPAVANLIREAKTFQIPSIMQTAKNLGMQTQTDALLALVKQGLVAPAEAWDRAAQKSEMKAALERAGHGAVTQTAA
ncbi:MAG: type IV pilus twitching motility protein PilT [Myxococcota bacterium]